METTETKINLEILRPLKQALTTQTLIIRAPDLLFQPICHLTFYLSLQQWLTLLWPAPL